MWAVARLALGPLLFAIPFGLFFGTIYGTSWKAYAFSYEMSVVFAYAITITIALIERLVLPLTVPEPVRPGTGRFWLRTLHYVGGSILGCFVGAAIINATLAPGFLGGRQQFAIVGTWALMFAILVSGLILAVQFYQRAVSHARAEQELDLARRIQRSFLPTEFPDLPRLDIHAVNVPSREVSGDFYDVYPAGDGAVLLAIADVVGKGVPAALLSSMLQASLRTQAPGVASVAEILVTINRLVHRSTAAHQFATFFLARIDARTLDVTYSNAGHNPPILVRGDGRSEALDRGGTVVGILEDASFEEGRLTLGLGDRLVLYTDGISEAAPREGALFGDDRLERVVAGFPPSLASRDAASRILDAVAEHLAGAEPGDDMTLLLMRVRGDAEPSTQR